jgi:YfiR/HmsC-like
VALLSQSPSSGREKWDWCGWLRASVPTILISLLIAPFVPEMRGQSDAPTESEVKAAFLYNFAKFVAWPSEAFSGSNAPMRFCVLGESPVGPDLSRITQGRAIGGHPIQVIQNSRDLHECHLLFVSSSHKGSVKEVGEALHGAPVLTVGETKGFTGQGGMIGFMVEDARVRFEVNLQAAKQMRLEISSKLLSLAKRVTT